jgi:hypothetical protein
MRRYVRAAVASSVPTTVAAAACYRSRGRIPAIAERVRLTVHRFAALFEQVEACVEGPGVRSASPWSSSI